MDSSQFITNFDLVNASKQELTAKLLAHLKSGQGLLTVFTPNAEQVVQAKHNPEFYQALKQADILIPDGKGLVWGYNFLLRGHSESRGQPVQRIAGVDLTANLIKQISKFDSSLGQTKMLLIGGKNYQQSQLPTNLKWIEGFKDINSPRKKEQQTIQKIVKSWQPEIVFVAFGAPKQEQWVTANQDWLERAGVKLAMVVGGSFDTLTGKLKRAPLWMGQCGLEWFYRLIQEPWRWRRQLRLFQFVGLVIKERLSN